ncbi:MAG TPA: winged helix-turn-helix domain-containing protein [Frankiaceae bacterium]|nr:winged helix-turn-helix domain-containing protein [Frankiaceae bacterium]
MTLTATEFDLLVALLRRPGRVLTREWLLSQVWGYEAAAGTRTVDVHVAQLRAKLGAASPIRTVRGSATPPAAGTGRRERRGAAPGSPPASRWSRSRSRRSPS